MAVGAALRAALCALCLARSSASFARAPRWFERNMIPGRQAAEHMRSLSARPTTIVVDANNVRGAVNFRISKWPYPDTRAGVTVDDDGRSYWANAQGTAAEDTYTVDLPAQGDLGEELRLEAGDVITLVATLTGAVAGAALTASLTPFGRKVKKLVE